MNKKIFFGKEAREKVQIGVNKITDAVAATLGANGRNVLIARSQVVDYGVRALPVHVTKDGVSVAREVHLEDIVENVGATMIKEAAEKTMSLAGDGTTTTTVLAREIVNQGIEVVNNGGNPMEFKRGVDAAVEMVVANLQKMAVSVGEKDVEKIRQVATVSANNDQEIGDLIASAFEKIGRDGIINIEESQNSKTEIKVTDGFEFLRGYVSPWFVTSPAKMICELEDPLIILYEKRILTMKAMLPILEKIGQGGMRPVLIVCEDMDEEALAFCITNKQKGSLPCCVVQAPNFGEHRTQIMEDIATVTGGTYISDSKGVSLEKMQYSHLGSAKKIVVSKDKTTILQGGGNRAGVEQRIYDLKIALSEVGEEDEREVLEKRISKLGESAATIYVGAATETEMKEKKDRVDDAVRATKAAIAEGYVSGGGSAFVKASIGLDLTGEGSYLAGVLSVGIAVRGPLRQILKNAGVDEKTLQEVIKSGGNVGYNAKTGELVDMIESGIIDPAKVLRCALQNAASVATMIVTSEVMIVDSIN
jgi:chaperonin GroEL